MSATPWSSCSCRCSRRRPWSCAAAGEGAISSLTRDKGYLTATGRIRLGGRDVSGVCRLRAAEETVASRRRILQQSYYLAAVQLLARAPASVPKDYIGACTPTTR